MDEEKIKNCYAALRILNGEELECALKQLPIINLISLSLLSLNIFHEELYKMLEQIKKMNMQ